MPIDHSPKGAKNKPLTRSVSTRATPAEEEPPSTPRPITPNLSINIPENKEPLLKELTPGSTNNPSFGMYHINDPPPIGLEARMIERINEASARNLDVMTKSIDLLSRQITEQLSRMVRTPATSTEYSMPVNNNPLPPRRELTHPFPTLDKWGIRFNGTDGGNSVEEFLRHFDSLCKLYEVTWVQIRKSFQLLLGGSALRWYLDFLGREPEHDWPSLKAALMQMFGSFATDTDILIQIMQEKQKDHEPVNKYFERVLALRQGMKVPTPEKEFVGILYRLLKGDLAQQVDPTYMITIEQLRQRCLNIEHREGPLRFNSHQRQIHELHTELPDYSIARPVEELKTGLDNNSQRSWKCWNCQQTGHGFFNCTIPIKHPFCFSCGKPGVLKPNCPRCSQGNPVRDRPPLGPPRPKPH